VLKAALGMVAPDVEIDDGKGMIQCQLFSTVLHIFADSVIILAGVLISLVTGQFRCTTLELCNFDAKQSNLILIV